MTRLGDEIPATEFSALYFQRWGIEEDDKHQKCRAELENFSGKTVHSVYQDIYAKLLTINLSSMCAFAAEEQVQQGGTEGVTIRSTVPRHSPRQNTIWSALC